MRRSCKAHDRGADRGGAEARARLETETAKIMQLVLRRANISRKCGDWNDDDFDVFDGERSVGRIYRVNAGTEIWFWGVSFLLTNRTSYSHAPTLDEAKAAFKAEYEAWKSCAG
jgi:hypothetical protein